MSTMPFKVALFIAQPTAIPTLNLLMQQHRLAGVVFPPEFDNALLPLESALVEQQVPCARLTFGQEEITADLLKRWESDMIVAFGFSGEVPPVLLGATRLGYFDMHLADSARFDGNLPLYWQIRSGLKNAEVVLQRSQAQSPNIAQSLAYKIDRLDTYKLVENKAAAAAAKCIDGFIESVIAGGEMPPLMPSKGESAKADMPTEADIYVDFTTMDSDEIINMARAGNPIFNGCAVMLGQTPLSLLQATKVKYPTYGVKPGTICYTGGVEGVVVATKDGAIRLDILANIDGVFGAEAFVERFEINAGMELVSVPANK